MAKKKKQSLLSRLGKLSEAKKLLVFLLVFVVIGGGYMAYRSFAATPNGCEVSAYSDYYSTGEYGEGYSRCKNLYRPKKDFERHCLYVSIQRKQDNWASVANDTKCSGSKVPIVIIHHKVGILPKNECSTIRTYAKSWLDMGQGTTEQQVITDLSKSTNINCN